MIIFILFSRWLKPCTKRWKPISFSNWIFPKCSIKSLGPSFFIEVLKHLGFSKSWCDLICLILATSLPRFQWMGSQVMLFSTIIVFSLRQGDPSLSPIPFILVMDMLKSLIKLAIKRQLLQPKVVPHVTHWASFYVDDAIIFFQPTTNNLQVMKFLYFFLVCH